MGDTPSRKAMVDSVLLGCIPVLFSRRQTTLWPWHWRAAKVSVVLDGDAVEADAVHIVDGGGQSDRLGDRRGAGLELRGRASSIGPRPTIHLGTTDFNFEVSGANELHYMYKWQGPHQTMKVSVGRSRCTLSLQRFLTKTFLTSASDASRR